MALRDFTFAAYNPNLSALTDYSDQIEEVSFSTTAPGGYGDLTTKLHIANARLQAQQPQFALFARVALMDGPFPCFQGRWDEPAIALDASLGDVVELHANGASSALQDDPEDASYSAQTALQVITDQLTSSTLKRNKTLSGTGNWLDADTSLILPTNPGDTFTAAYNGMTMEQVLNDLLSGEGNGGSTADYTWAVWGHPSANLASGSHVDALGFPTWALQAHGRDTSTVSYMAYLDDILDYTIAPSVDYAYNAIQVLYRDAATLLPASITVTDSRLNGDHTQGTAPFAWRLLRKDYSSYAFSSTQAQNIATALLTSYKNASGKITVRLGSVRDANGNPFPLHRVRADANIFIPELAPLGPQLPTTASTYSWYQGGTTFYIQETQFAEQQGSTPEVTLACDAFKDNTAFLVKQLSLAPAKKASNTKVVGFIQASGEAVKGTFVMTYNPNAAGITVKFYVNFPNTLSASPSSVTLTTNSSSNASSITAGDLSQTGFSISWTIPSSGSISSVNLTWKTNGN